MAHDHITTKEESLRCTHCKTTLNLFHPFKPGPVQAFMQQHAACAPIKPAQGSLFTTTTTRSTPWTPSSL